MSITNLNDFKNRKTNMAVKSTQEKYNDAIDRALPLWEAAYSAGTISKLLSLETGYHLENHNDFVQVKNLEAYLNLGVIVFAPNAMHTRKNANGWVAGFAIDNESYATPEMLTEPDARAFNILLYITIKNIIS